MTPASADDSAPGDEKARVAKSPPDGPSAPGETPVHPASMAFFRIAFGGILLYEMLRYFQRGWIDEYFVEPSFHFRYEGFAWLSPLPGWGMKLLFGGLALSALGICVGWRTRMSAAAFTLGFTYVFLLEKARYLNHFYLVILLSALLMVLPTGQAYSLDAWRRPRPFAVPRWSLELLRFQIGIVYFYAGVAKINPDWLRGEPMRSWLAARADHPLLGPLLTMDGAAWFFSYGGMIFDLLVWPLMVWKPSRRWCFLAVLFFHLANSQMFGIGIFPATMLAATTLFFAPDWPRRWVPGFGGGRREASGQHEVEEQREAERRSEAEGERVVGGQRLWGWGVGLWVLLQVLIPLRHFLYPGSVHWTEEGHAFSWHMKLRSKQGEAIYRIVDRDDGSFRLRDPRMDLNHWQLRKMNGRPDMLLQYAHHLRDLHAQQGRDVAIYVRARVSLNGRPSQLLIDPDVDLSQVRSGIAPASWITRLNPRP